MREHKNICEHIQANLYPHLNPGRINA
jgi:hypothetical protein